MKIVVKLGAPLSQVVGESKVILTVPEGANISSVLDELRAALPRFSGGVVRQGAAQAVRPSAIFTVS